MTREQFAKYLGLKNQGVTGNSLKAVIQEDIINIWLRAGGKGILEAYTGFGKTHLCNRLFERYRTASSEPINIVVPTNPLYVDFTDMISENNFTDVDTFIINSYVKQTRSCGLLVIDEVHKVANKYSKEFKRVIPLTEHKYGLGLSATINDSHKEYLESLGYKVIFTITKHEAFKLGLLPNYNIYNIGVDFTMAEQIKYQKAYDVFSATFEVFKNSSKNDSFAVAMACCQKEHLTINLKKRSLTVKEILEAVAKKNELKVEDIRKKAFAWKASMMQLSKLCDNAIAKNVIAKAIVEKYEDKRIIIFHGSIYNADELAKQIPDCYAYHSKSKQRTKLLQSFLNQFFNKIVSINALDLGFSDKTISVGINLSYDNDEKQMVQREGRVIRLDESDPNKHSLFFNVFCNPFEGVDSNNEKFTIYPADYNKLRELSRTNTVEWIDDLDEIDNETFN